MISENINNLLKTLLHNSTITRHLSKKSLSCQTLWQTNLTFFKRGQLYCKKKKKNQNRKNKLWLKSCFNFTAVDLCLNQCFKLLASLKYESLQIAFYFLKRPKSLWNGTVYSTYAPRIWIPFQTEWIKEERKRGPIDKPFNRGSNLDCNQSIFFSK